MPTLPHLNTWWDRRTRRGTQLLQPKLIRKPERQTHTRADDIKAIHIHYKIYVNLY